MITPTSTRRDNGATRSTSPPSARARDALEPRTGAAAPDAQADKLPPLVLTQIHFMKGMRGRFGSTAERDQTEPHWYDFYGDIQLARAKVETAGSLLDFDKLPEDVFFLTGQTLNVRTEPPPVGSPPSTPAHDYVKAWETAKVRASDKVVDADVITYDSEKDLVYAYGEGGRPVSYAEQYANGQPFSAGTAKAIRLNPKSGAFHFTENATIQIIDKNSGVRPNAAPSKIPTSRRKKLPRRASEFPAATWSAAALPVHSNCRPA